MESHGHELNQSVLSSTAEPVSSALEEALSDSSLSNLQRMRRATAIELVTLFRLAAPAIVVYLLNNVTSMATQIFCGHLGNLELAAVSLGNNGIQIFAYGVMVISSLSPVSNRQIDRRWLSTHFGEWNKWWTGGGGCISVSIPHTFFYRLYLVKFLKLLLSS